MVAVLLHRRVKGQLNSIASHGGRGDGEEDASHSINSRLMVERGAAAWHLEEMSVSLEFSVPNP